MWWEMVGAESPSFSEKRQAQTSAPASDAAQQAVAAPRSASASR